MSSEIRVLIVNDNETLATQLQHSLRQMGYAVDVALSAEEALKAIQAQRYGAVVLDWFMDGIGGLGFLKQYRDYDPGLAVLVMSDRPSIEAATQVLQGGREALAKTYLIAKLDMPADYLPELIDENIKKYFVRQELGDFLIDREQGTVYWKDQPVNMTPLEWRVFEVLARSPKVMSYQDIAWEVYRERLSPEEAKSRLRAQIYRLRQNIKKVANYEAIKSEQGVGFWIVGRNNSRKTIPAG